MQVQEFHSVAEMQAHYAQVRMRIRGPVRRHPAPLPAPKPRAPGFCTGEDMHDEHVKAFHRYVLVTAVERARSDPAVNAHTLMAATVAGTGYTVSDLKGISRKDELAFYRHLAMTRVRRAFPHYSLPMIGRLFGGKDHTTVLSAVRRIEKYEAMGLMDEGWPAVHRHKARIAQEAERKRHMARKAA